MEEPPLEIDESEESPAVAVGPVDMEIDDHEGGSQTKTIGNSTDEDRIAKSRFEKEQFLELFRKAPKVKDVLPELKEFFDHPDVLPSDIDDVRNIVAERVDKEKAAKKRERIEKKVPAPMSSASDLASALKNVAGIDFTPLIKAKENASIIPGISQDNLLVHPQIPISSFSEAPPNYVHNSMITPHPMLSEPRMSIPSVQQPIFPEPKAPSILRSITSMKDKNILGVGIAGFTTPHPSDIPRELKILKPEDVAPIPDVLQENFVDPNQILPVPNELLPPELRKYEKPIERIVRKTLILAGARPRRSEMRKAANDIKKSSIQKVEKDSGEPASKRKRLNKSTIDELNDKLLPGIAPVPIEMSQKRRDRQRGGRDRAARSGANSAEPVLHKETPFAVRRYHAKQLAKETGISMEEALTEIDEQCMENEAPPPSSKPPRSAPPRNDDWAIADHSRGIPGVDRPPDQRIRKRGGVRERERQRKREEAERRRKEEREGGGRWNDGAGTSYRGERRNRGPRNRDNDRNDEYDQRHEYERQQYGNDEQGNTYSQDGQYEGEGEGYQGYFDTQGYDGQYDQHYEGGGQHQAEGGEHSNYDDYYYQQGGDDGYYQQTGEEGYSNQEYNDYYGGTDHSTANRAENNYKEPQK